MADEDVGRTIQDYTENTKNIDCVDLKLRRTEECLLAWVEALRQSPPKSLRVGQYNDVDTSGATIKALLRQRQELLGQRFQIEEQMRRMRLHQFISQKI